MPHNSTSCSELKCHEREYRCKAMLKQKKFVNSVASGDFATDAYEGLRFAKVVRPVQQVV